MRAEEIFRQFFGDFDMFGQDIFGQDARNSQMVTLVYKNKVGTALNCEKMLASSHR